jgi:hypothetical protein
MTSTADIVLGLSLVVGPLCAAGLSLAPGRRVALLLLLGVFTAAGATIGLAQSIRLGLGLAATGFVACALLALGFQRGGWTPDGLEKGGRAFRAATVMLVAAAAWGLAIPYAASAGAIPAPRLTSAVMILAMGLLQLGLSQEQGAAAVGLLTTLAGFEVWYAGLEPSLALRAVLAAITLGIALVSGVLLQDVRATPTGRGP